VRRRQAARFGAKEIAASELKTDRGSSFSTFLTKARSRLGELEAGKFSVTGNRTATVRTPTRFTKETARALRSVTSIGRCVSFEAY